jgi:hypothetical protein
VAKGDRVYAGTDADARWIPEGEAFVKYMEKRKEEAAMDSKGTDEPVVASTENVEPVYAGIPGDDILEVEEILDEEIVENQELEGAPEENPPWDEEDEPPEQDEEPEGGIESPPEKIEDIAEKE